MAGKALGVGDLLPEDVTLGAVRHPFEVGVNLGEFAGRDLGF
jgi:hypothetical protein